MVSLVSKRKALFLMSTCLIFSTVTESAFSFVLLSGPSEAKLDATEQNPTIQFRLSTAIPSISGKDRFMSGQYANLDDEAFWSALIGEAMRPWNDVSDAYIKLEIGEVDSDAAVNKEDLVHSIVVDSVNLSIAAFAQPNIEDDKIIDCDITVGKKSADAQSLAFTMMHEFGHCLGLGHNHTDYDAVMGYSRDDDKLRLGLDDRMGLLYLYANDEISNPHETMGCGVLSEGSVTKDSRRIMLFLALIPLFLVLLRSRFLFRPL